MNMNTYNDHDSGIAVNSLGSNANNGKAHKPHKPGNGWNHGHCGSLPIGDAMPLYIFLIIFAIAKVVSTNLIKIRLYKHKQ